ncbi:MAG: tetratricopeptide repeat protein, partial [Deltaproteobacteria bacterium]
EAAFRRQEWKTVSQELGRYVELEPKLQDNMIWFHLGSARVQTREFQGAIQPLENFLKGTGGTKTAQYAGLLLGQANEEVGNSTRAREVCERALSLYPGSDFAPMIRGRLRKIAGANAPLGTPPATAAAPKQ